MVTSPKLVIVEPVSAVKTMFTDSPLRLSDKKVMPDAIIYFFLILNTNYWTALKNTITLINIQDLTNGIFLSKINLDTQYMQ